MRGKVYAIYLRIYCNALAAKIRHRSCALEPGDSVCGQIPDDSGTLKGYDRHVGVGWSSLGTHPQFQPMHIRAVAWEPIPNFNQCTLGL